MPPDRRNPQDLPPTSTELRAELNEPQLTMVNELERFGWDLRFVRQPPQQPPVPVLFSGDEAFLCLRPDGTMDESDSLAVRH